MLAGHQEVTSRGPNRAEGIDDVCRWLSHVRSKRTGLKRGDQEAAKTVPQGQSMCVRTSGLQNESRRACPELVERGRLNLAQDASPG